MMVNESNLQQDEFVERFGGEPGTGRKGLYGITLSHFESIPTFKAQRSSRCKGSTALLRSEKKFCPKAIGDYVDNMGGEDTGNQLGSFFQ
jgi:hypothetical protein